MMAGPIPPLCFCIACRRLNRPRPTRWCAGCGQDLRAQEEELVQGGVHRLLEAYAPPHLTGAQFFNSLRDEDLVLLFHEAFHLWARAGSPSDWPRDFPAPPPGMPHSVARALAHLGQLGAEVSVPELHWAYRTLCKAHHPDVGGDPTGERMRLINDAYAIARRWATEQGIAARPPAADSRSDQH